MRERMNYAFVPGVWNSEAFEIVGNKTAEIKDIRIGLFLMKESGSIAEDASSKKITKEHAEKAIKKLDVIDADKSKDLDEEEKFMFRIIKKNNGKKSGDIFRAYLNEGGESVYKTFQRKVKKFEKLGLISTKTIIGGTEGTTTVIEIKQVKKPSN
jgi:cell division control protein 6